MPGVSAISSGEAAIERVHRPEPLGEIAGVDLPDPSIPSPKSTRAKGRAFEASIASTRLRAESLGEALEAREPLRR